MGNRDDQTHGRDDVERDLRGRLAEAWLRGDFKVFYSTLDDELVPRLHREIAAEFRCGREDREDCISQVLERLVERQDEDRSVVRDPLAYIRQAVRNAARDLLNGRKRDGEALGTLREIRGTPHGRARGWQQVSPDDAPEEVEDDDDPRPDAGAAGQPDQEIPAAWAAVVVEELVGDVEVEPHWAQELVREAILRLPTGQRHVIEYLMYQDYDYQTSDLVYRASTAAAALGISAGAFRTNKSRAFDRLRSLIPEVANELGLTLPLRVAETILGWRYTLPSDDQPE